MNNMFDLTYLFKKLVIFLITLFLLPIYSSGAREKIEIFLEAGVKNNAMLKKPRLDFDTTFNISLSKIKSFPSWGYYMGCKTEMKIYRNTKISIGLQFDKDEVIGKVDSATAIYMQQYFGDPLIEQIFYTSKISLPIYFSYFKEKFSLGIGFYNSIFFWTSQSQSTLSGILFPNDKKYFWFHPIFPISLNLNYAISKKIGVNLSYDFSSQSFSPFEWVKLGFEYKIITL